VNAPGRAGRTAIPGRCARRLPPPLPLACSSSILNEREFAELSYRNSGWKTVLELTHIPSGFGGSRVFWLCPHCGWRARFLYFKDRGFLCRECARLNYRSQQRTRDSINYARDGLKLAREKLGWEPPGWISPMDFPSLTPPCPRYMHRATYERHLARFRQYQAAYRQDSLRKTLAILRL